MSDWQFLNRHRATSPMRWGAFATTADDGFKGIFEFPVPGEARRVRAIASDGFGWRHVSVSFGGRSKGIPSWETMCKVKDLFFEPTETVVQYHPPTEDHVNYHEACLHLWAPNGWEMPRPDWRLVGAKNGKAPREMKDPNEMLRMHHQQCLEHGQPELPPALRDAARRAAEAPRVD